MRVRGNAHQVFDKYQALAREAAASGDRIMAEAYWQYADHYFRLIQTMGGFIQRNNQGWGDGQGGEEGQQQANPQQQGGQQANPQQANGNGYAEHRQGGSEPRQGGDEPRQGGGDGGRGAQDEGEPGLGGVAFLQNGRGTPGNQDPAAEDQPDVPEFSPPTGRRGERR